MWHTRRGHPWWIMSSADGGCLEQSKTKRTDEVAAIATSRDKTENFLFNSMKWGKKYSLWGHFIFPDVFFFSWKFVPVSFPSLHWRTLFIASHFHPCPFEISNSYHLSSGKSLIRLIMPDCLPKTGRAETALNAGRNKPGLAGISMRRKTVIHIATEK